jgi:hypothetical protein
MVPVARYAFDGHDNDSLHRCLQDTLANLPAGGQRTASARWWGFLALLAVTGFAGLLRGEDEPK